jgi:hypothetical protein
MKNTLAAVIAVCITTACGPQDEAELSPGVSHQGLGTSTDLPFWIGMADPMFSVGHGQLYDVPADGFLGWVGQPLKNVLELPIAPSSNMVANATLSWNKFTIPVSGWYILHIPSGYVVDGYARSHSAVGITADTDTFLRVEVTVGRWKELDAWTLVANTTPSHASESFNVFVPTQSQVRFYADAGTVISFQASLLLRGRTGPLSTGVIGIHRFGIYTNSMPNTAEPITIVQDYP